ncbi:MAG: cobalt transporter [Rhizobiales bacterium]|nr:cobalt transporter [Hyphomicrobiales bacterium]MBA67778.1 cobalt transporter [Hyphomicrobiales bacterium]|tara:strand:- start:222 stop:950 length:729 start_codon:yes stop_codon:yes gene_type:complete
MIVRLLLAALAAGLIAGLAMTPAQYTKIVPLILEAETYETMPAADEVAGEAGHAHADGHEHGDEASILGFGRLGNTILANIAAGGGFALLLAGTAMLIGLRFPQGGEGVRRGLMLGAAAWFAVQLAPGWGLPPELPGFPYVDLVERQVWWIAAVILSAGGVYLIALRPEWIAKVAGVALIVAPHLYGAPQPADISSNVPAFLASEYTTASLATTLFFWLLLGGLLGFFLSRVEDGDAVAQAG